MVHHGGATLTAVRTAVALLACLLATGLVFHAQIGDGFATLFNDPWDGWIEVALLEHWWNALRLLEPWRAPLWFSPSRDSLGYNDGYLAFGLVHALFRWCGIDEFLSADLVTLVIRAIGFPGFLLLARQGLRLDFWPALAGATVFTMADNMVMQMEHAQLVTVSLAPWLWWLIGRCWSALGDGRRDKALAWGLATAALVALWLMTAFYTLWFTILFLCLLAAFRVGWLARHAGRVAAWPVAASVAALALGSLPFLWTYLPTRHETGGHRFDEVLGFAPRLDDFVDVGTGNLLWGQLAEPVRASLRWTMAGAGEHVVGWPPLLLASALAGVSVALWRRDRLWMALGAATILAVLLPVTWGSAHWTAWRLVYAAVPGAAAIRSTTRFALVLTLPVTLLAAYALGAVRLPRAVLAGLAALLMFEEINVAPRAEWPRRRYLAEVDVASPPPGLCSHFIVKQPRYPEAEQPSILMNVEAMVVAERLHLPTLNGHASFLPRYRDSSYSQQAEYEEGMAALALQAGLTAGLCELDLRSGVWTAVRMPEPAAPELGRPYRLSGDVGGFTLGPGWSVSEPDGRWSDGDTGVLMFRNPRPDMPLRLTLRAKGYPPASPHAASISVDGIEVARWYPGPQARAMTAELPPRPAGMVSVTIDIDHPRSPASLGLGEDTRDLGLFVEAAELSAPAQ